MAEEEKATAAIGVGSAEEEEMVVELGEDAESMLMAMGRRKMKSRGKEKRLDH